MDWKVRIITFNVAMKGATKEAAKELVHADQHDQHLLVIGLQEVSHGEQYGNVHPSWQATLVSVVGSDTPFTLIARTFQATNLLLIFARRDELRKIGKVNYRYAKTTMGGLTGHKGSIGALVTLANKSSLSFTLSHFVHDVTRLHLRIGQFHANKQCAFRDVPSVVGWFWLGDLNFRVEKEAEDAAEDILEGRIQELLDADQLRSVMRKGQAFNGFKEQDITFLPTYRFAIGTAEFDLKRTPSYCDRILYDGASVSGSTYTRQEGPLVSDHLPVTAHFNVRMATMDRNEWRVPFQPVPTWYTTIPLMVRFQLKGGFWGGKGSYSDWIGVFPAVVKDCTKPIRWVYVMTCYDDGSSPVPWTVAEFSELQAGEYCVGYHSAHYNCIVGMSGAFNIIDVEQSS